MNNIVDTVAEIALARILSKTPFVGFIGKIVFLASSIVTNTFHAINHKASARFAEHDVIYGKPLTEFTGIDLKDFTIEITLLSTLGVDPLLMYEAIEDMAEKGAPQLVFINYKNCGRYTLRSVEADEKYWHGGRPAVMDIVLTLREYVESLSTEAERKLREAELKREDTGIGGPDKLPGMPADVPKVSLTPIIDPVTRM